MSACKGGINVPESPLSRQFVNCLRQFDPDMDEWVAGAAHLTIQAVIEGHVCVDLRHYAGRRSDEGMSWPGLSAWIKSLEGSSVIGQPGDFRPLILQDLRLYLARYWQYESNLAKSLLARAVQVCDEVDLGRLRADLDILFAHNTERPDWQKVAAATAVRRRLCVISGGPGTGKTSTVVRILAALQAQAEAQLRIVLAAPTGKAAARMQEAIRAQKEHLPFPQTVLKSIPEAASTLHRLLGSQPDSIYFRHHRDHPLPVDVVVVDEASMIDLALMSKLIDALPSHARLILLGDKDQLAAVEAGAVFADVCAGKQDSASFGNDPWQTETTEPGSGVAAQASPLSSSIVLLKRSHRFGSDSGIGELARLTNQGKADAAIDLLQSQRFADIVWRCARVEAVKDELLEVMDEGYRAYFRAVEADVPEREILAAFNRFRVLTAHREGVASAAMVNRSFDQRVRERLKVSANARWYSGRPIMITRNDYGLKLFNGDIGICLRQGGELRVCFEETDGRIRSLAPGRLPEHEAVYAMTVHNSQGSEFEEVVFLLPDAESPALMRPLIYTAITRARKRMQIWGSHDSVVTAISKAPERIAGLVERLWACL